MRNSLVDLARLERRRDVIYRRTRARRVRTMEDATQFINAVGFSLLFASTQAIELPSLFEAVKGRRDAHIDDWDADADRVWTWTGDLPAARRAYYGKALAGGKPVFISLQMLPYVYVLAAPRDLNEEYARGRVSLEAKRVYDALYASGPMPTMALRAAAGLDRSGDTPRYHRALDELQRALVIAPVGAVKERGAWTSRIFDLVPRWFPRQVARAQRIGTAEAQRAFVKRYMQTVVAAKAPPIARTLGLRREQVSAAVDDLIARQVLSKRDDWVMWTSG